MGYSMYRPTAYTTLSLAEKRTFCEKTKADSLLSHYQLPSWVTKPFHTPWTSSAKLYKAYSSGRQNMRRCRMPNMTANSFVSPVLWQKLYEVALGLHFLHERNVTHGDLKGNNILVGADGTAKLTDFGMSLMLTGSVEMTPVVGTIGALRWKAPEV